MTEEVEIYASNNCDEEYEIQTFQKSQDTVMLPCELCGYVHLFYRVDGGIVHA